MDEDFERRDGGCRLKATVPRCWFGMFRMLGFHQWHYIRKINRGRKPKGRRGLGCYATPKTISFAKHHGDMQQVPDSEAKPLEVRLSSAEARSVLDIDPSSTRARARASLTAAEISEEKVDELWFLGIPAHQLHGIEPEWNNSIIVLKDKDDVQSSKLKDSRGCYSSRNLSDVRRMGFSEGCEEEEKNTDGAKEGMEISEINRELLSKIVQDPCVAIWKKLDDHQTLQRKAKFAKSRSFPVDDLSGVKNLKPSTLKHKQNEVWSFPKEDKQVAETPSDPAKAPIRNVAEVSGRSVVHGWNQMILNHLRGFKRRIRRALRDNRNDTQWSVKAPATVDLSGDMIEDHRGGSSLMNDGQSGESKRQSFWRTSSLHESADKYARLFEATSTRDVELPHSRSLKLANDVKPTSNETSVKTFRRRLSLPENLSFLFSEASFGMIHTSMSLTNDREFSAVAGAGDTSNPESVELDSNSKRPSEVTASTNFLETMEEAGEVSFNNNSEDISTDENHENVEVISFNNDSGDIATGENHENAEVNLAIVIETSLHERTEIAASDEQLNSVSCPETLPSEAKIKPENETDSIDLNNLDSIRSILYTHAADNISRSIRLDEKDDAAFIFVCNVLMMSGMFDNELELWYSEDQPLNPKLFHEVNASAKPGTEFNDHRLQLLFDLVNGSLLEIFEQSASYFPKAFSFNDRVRSIPKGEQMVKEVWTRVNRLWGLRPELDQSLDDVMGRDMAKGDGWLNCQWDGECVALELEDLMFHELLDELLNSLVI